MSRWEEAMAEISRRQFFVASVAGFSAASGWVSSARAQSAIALRVSSSMPADDNAAHYAWHQLFAANLKDAVGDRIRLDYFPNSQLGKEADVVQQVKIGSIDMMITGSSIWATVAPELGMLDLGYLFDSFEHAAKALDAGAGKDLEKILMSRTNVTVLGWGFHFGARNVYTKTPVRSLAELKDRKLRVLPAPAFIETFQLMGATPTPIPVNELYTALQTGVVDGFEHDAGTVLAQKFYEVANKCFMTQHLFSPMFVAIGKRGLDKVPADLRPKFMEAASQATQAQRKVAAGESQEAIDALKALNVEFAPMPESEREATRKVMEAKLYARFMQQYPPTKPIFDAIAAARRST